MVHLGLAPHLLLLGYEVHGSRCLVIAATELLLLSDESSGMGSMELVDEVQGDHGIAGNRDTILCANHTANGAGVL